VIKDRLETDIKTALLSGDKQRVLVLRGLKSSILYEEVALKVRETGLSDEAIIALFQREAKKRQESADLYKQGGSEDRVTAELQEKAIIQEYLPAQLDEVAISAAIEKAITEVGDSSPAAVGKLIGAVKAQLGGAADGSTIARLVKERLAS
jgi:uncharacterized protein YqeY